MEKAAHKTSLISFYFLAAWTALNTQDLERCIELCRQVGQPYAPLCTLQGQALLESGRAEEAIAVLELASELDPQEVLTWFQLAKAEMVLGLHKEAWQTLGVCETLCPQHPEIGVFYTLLALEEDAPRAWQNKAWESLAGHLPTQAAQAGVVVPLIKLALQAEHKTWAERVINQAHWQSLSGKLLASGELTFILKELGKKQWWDLAEVVLGQVSTGLAKPKA